MTKLDAHGKTVEAIDASMSTLSGKYDELLKRLDEQCATIKELTKRTGQLEAKVAEQDLQIRELKIAVDNAEQYSRRKNIEIHGIAQRPNENMLEVVKNLADKLELPQLAPEDVEAAHRLGAREGKTAPILVRFVERRTRDLWMTKRWSAEEGPTILCCLGRLSRPPQPALRQRRRRPGFSAVAFAATAFVDAELAETLGHGGEVEPPLRRLDQWNHRFVHWLNTEARKFNDTVKDYCRKPGKVTLLDHDFTSLPPLRVLAADGLHPSFMGVALLSANLKSILQRGTRQ
ncbi:uncharacterized protein ISCGN_031388 [Ixodes scapularis]